MWGCILLCYAVCDECMTNLLLGMFEISCERRSCRIGGGGGGGGGKGGGSSVG